MPRQDIEQIAHNLGISVEDFQERLRAKLEAAGLVDKGSAEWIRNPSPQTTEGVPLMRFGIYVDPKQRMHVYVLNWQTGDYIPLEDDSPMLPRDAEVVGEQPQAPPYIDCHALSEEQRIALIGTAAVSGQIVNFIVEDNEKADRYVAQLVLRFPVKILERFAGPAHTVCVKVGPSKVH